ncbi:hypothetical protein FBU30_009642 [Linnemannia zychae]|nr:hypothetical protein FBU30_009642 [Linnemannia zychae]
MTSQQQDGDPPPLQPLPSIGVAPPISYAAMAAGVRNVHKPRMYMVFSDPVDGNLAARALAPKGARLEDVKNLSAVAFVIPKASSWTSFLDAIWTTHAQFFAEHEDVIPFPILSNSTFSCTDGINQRIESSKDLGEDLEIFYTWYFEKSNHMDKVIKIEVPLFPTPNDRYSARDQFAVYVKSVSTADAYRID